MNREILMSVAALAETIFKEMIAVSNTDEELLATCRAMAEQRVLTTLSANLLLELVNSPKADRPNYVGKLKEQLQSDHDVGMAKIKEALLVSDLLSKAAVVVRASGSN